MTGKTLTATPHPKIHASPAEKHAAKRSLWALAIFAVLVVGFVWLAREVRDAETLTLDTRILMEIREESRTALNRPIIWLTNSGGSVVVPIVTLLMVVWLFVKRHVNAAFKLILGVGGASLIGLVLKSFYARARPELWDRLVVEHSFSFPSGHAIASAALAASLITISWHTKWRYWVAVPAVLWMLGIAFTRLYLGVHYPSDIVAGWCVGLGWVALVNYIFGRTHREHGEKEGTLSMHARPQKTGHQNVSVAD